MRFQLTVQFVQHDPRFNNAAPSVYIKFQDMVQMLAVVDHDGVVDCLSTLRCAATTRQYGKPLGSGEIQRGLNIGQRFRNHHRMRHHLVD